MTQIWKYWNLLSTKKMNTNNRYNWTNQKSWNQGSIVLISAPKHRRNLNLCLYTQIIQRKLSFLFQYILSRQKNWKLGFFSEQKTIEHIFKVPYKTWCIFREWKLFTAFSESFEISDPSHILSLLKMFSSTKLQNFFSPYLLHLVWVSFNLYYTHNIYIVICQLANIKKQVISIILCLREVLVYAPPGTS